MTVVLLLLPLIFAVGGMLGYAVAHAVFGNRAGDAMAIWSGYLHLLLTLAVLLALAASSDISLTAPRPSVTGAVLALASPAGISVIAAAAAVGALLFYGELAFGILTHRLAARHPHMDGRAVVGNSGALLAVRVRSWEFLTLGVGLALAEELLWRKVFLDYFIDERLWSVGLTLVVSSALFGLNHYWFGLRNIVSKAIDGAAWGALYLVTGSIWAAVVSHAVFQLLVWRRLAGQHSWKARVSEPASAG